MSSRWLEHCVLSSFCFLPPPPQQINYLTVPYQYVGNITLGERMIDELERTWKEAVMAYLRS
jgi:hypothetical protein